MSDPKSHPRRRPFKNSLLPPLAASSNHVEHSSSRSIGSNAMSLKKGATFHAPTTPPSEDCDPMLSIPALPRRSPTCTRSLEQVIAAGERRMAGFLGSVERNLSGLGKDAPSTPSSPLDDQLPVPRGILNAHITNTDAMDTDLKPRNSKPIKSPGKACHRNHNSDSGIGSSISGSEQAEEQDNTPSSHQKSTTQESVVRLQGHNHSTVAKSASYKGLLSSQQCLSPRGIKQIERFTIIPILREKKLGRFHPLVRGIPESLANKDITCLRDLEKTLILLAPRYANSKASYISFCEFTIQCIHTTVGYLNDRDQRRPADRPYTNGYFLDLVEQIRQYALAINTARERRQSNNHRSPDSNNLDYSSAEELVLEGGLSRTGRPAELVRKKKGQTISLKTGQIYEEQKPIIPTLKRSISMESRDDSVMRSMARRKKDAPPLDINEKCKDCDKVFRRPCDLTKHQKTHSRPWKCTERSCKYFKTGWPTEKERDRHVNDKHSKAPPLFTCRFTPCTYQSKRESNCKQHMEKAHGWVYVRSKNNGKNGNRVSTHQTPQTPNIKTPLTGIMDALTPISAHAPSPYMSPYQPNLFPNGAGTYPINEMNNNPIENDFDLFPDTSGPGFDDPNPYTVPFDFNAFHAGLQASDPGEYVPSLDMNLPSATSSTTTGNDIPTAGFPDNQTPSSHASSHLDIDFDWDSMGDDYMAMHVQLLSPAQSTEAQMMKTYSPPSSISMPSPNFAQKVTNLSPGGQGNLMLYSPDSDIADEGFDDGYDRTDKPAGDFTLFESTGGNLAGHSNAMMSSSTDTLGIGSSNAMFPPLTSLNDQYHTNEWTQQINPMDINMDVDDIMRMDEF